MATHSSILSREFHGQRSLMGCSPWGHKSQTWLKQLSSHRHAILGACLTQQEESPETKRASRQPALLLYPEGLQANVMRGLHWCTGMSLGHKGGQEGKLVPEATASSLCLGMWNEAGQRLIEFSQENALVIANTLFQQHKRSVTITRWSTPKSDLLYSLQPKMKKLYTVYKNKTRS